MGQAGPGAPGAVGASARFDAHLHLSRFWPDLARHSYGPEIDFRTGGLLRELDASGIGGGLLLPPPQVPSAADALAEGRSLAQASGGRLLLAASVDPTLGPAAVTAALAQWSAVPELRAIKLYPGYRPFYPHDGRLDPVYEFAARRRLPVLFHQGDTMDPDGRVRYARPVEVDEVAVRFRDVRFVLCHLGNPWIDETAEIVYKNANVFADTSGLLAAPTTPRFRRMVDLARRRLAEAIVGIGSVARILFGSDWPLARVATAVALVDGLDLADADRAAILGGNARRLLGVGAASD